MDGYPRSIPLDPEKVAARAERARVDSQRTASERAKEIMEDRRDRRRRAMSVVPQRMKP